MIYLYAIADGLRDVGTNTGAAGEPLRVVEIHALDIVLGERPVAPPNRAALEAQDRVIRSLHARAAALLPMRFGIAYATLAEAANAMEPRAVDLRDGLSRVRDCDQMTLRLLGSSEPVDLSSQAEMEGEGARYLRRRAAVAVPPPVPSLLRRLDDLARATRVDAGRTSGLLATVYHLIPRGSHEDYLARVRRLQSDAPHVAMRVSGPSPCYAFT
jgi:hypothetical protein